MYGINSKPLPSWRRYNKLFTVTAQCLESELSRYRPMLQATINSFVPPAPVF